MLKYFGYSIIVTLLSLFFVFYHGYEKGGLSLALTMLWLTLILIIMEISLSFDNAIVNASILKHWNEFWKKIFLTVGILIAVFGMRLIFPIAIVAFTTGLGVIEVWDLAINNPDEYSKNLTAHHAEISAFGSMFLMLVFLSFFFDEEKQHHWVSKLEEKLSHYGRNRFISYVIAMILLSIFSLFVEENRKIDYFLAGFSGIGIYLTIQLICSFFGNQGKNTENLIKTGSLTGFLYLEILDASFSFDGVIGAFAITKDIILIMIGLGVGAFFVRSITIYLVDKGTLSQYIYLEHGAHYAIGTLAIIMLLAVKFHIPEVITGLLGITFILFSFFSSIRYNKS
ncbi:MAG: DUF475 domain-containing protein [Aliarcobacter sp.]